MKQPPLPKQIRVKDATYTVLFMRELDGGDLGGFDGINKLLLISLAQSREEMIATLFHEFLHAVEHEYRVRLGHPKIERLEWDLAAAHKLALELP
jgi:hypothetical protein